VEAVAVVRHRSQPAAANWLTDLDDQPKFAANALMCGRKSSLSAVACGTCGEQLDVSTPQVKDAEPQPTTSAGQLEGSRRSDDLPARLVGAGNQSPAWVTPYSACSRE
jgi:hypothetical protein